jgi:hypothetical protein
MLSLLSSCETQTVKCEFEDSEPHLPAGRQVETVGT